MSRVNRVEGSNRIEGRSSSHGSSSAKRSIRWLIPRSPMTCTAICTPFSRAQSAALRNSPSVIVMIPWSSEPGYAHSTQAVRLPAISITR